MKKSMRATSVKSPQVCFRPFPDKSYLKTFLTTTTAFVGAVLSGDMACAEERDLGVAYFAMMAPQFPCNEALDVFDKSLPFATAVLWETFGSDTKCIKDWFERSSSQKRVLEIHLTNEACRRNARCGATDFRPDLSVKDYNRLLAKGDEALLKSLRERVRAISTLVSPYVSPSTELILSTGLEDNFTKRAYEKIFSVVKEEWPHKVVRSPVGSLRDISHATADYVELHSDTPKFPDNVPCIANLDGTDISFPHRQSDQPSRLSWDEVDGFVATFGTRCRTTYLWAAPWQGISGTIFTAPASRSLQVDSRDVNLIRVLRKRFYSNTNDKKIKS